MFFFNLFKSNPIRDSIFNFFKARKGETRGGKYIQRIMVGGKYRYIYPSDHLGTQRRIKSTTTQHVKHHNKDQHPDYKLDKNEHGYIKNVAHHMHLYMKMHGIDAKDESKFYGMVNQYLKDHKITSKDLRAHHKEEGLDYDVETLVDNSKLYHDLAIKAVKEHLTNEHSPIKEHIKAEKAQKKGKEKAGVTSEKVKKIIKEKKPKSINKKYPDYHPLSMPTKEIKGKQARYYTARYTKEEPPRGMDKKIWSQAVDKYVTDGGKMGYQTNWKKIKNIYSGIKGKEIDPYQRYKKTDMIARVFMKKNPPDFIGENLKAWQYVVDRYFPKDKHGTHIQKTDYDKGEAGLRKYYFNALNKYGNTNPLAKPKKKVTKKKALKKSIFKFSF